MIIGSVIKTSDEVKREFLRKDANSRGGILYVLPHVEQAPRWVKHCIVHGV